MNHLRRNGKKEGESASWRAEWQKHEREFEGLIDQQDAQRAYELYSNVLEDWLGLTRKEGGEPRLQHQCRSLGSPPKLATSSQ